MLHCITSLFYQIGSKSPSSLITLMYNLSAAVPIVQFCTWQECIFSLFFLFSSLSLYLSRVSPQALLLTAVIISHRKSNYPISLQPGIGDGYSKRFGSSNLPDLLSCGVVVDKCGLCLLLLESLALQIEGHCVCSVCLSFSLGVSVFPYMCKCADTPQALSVPCPHGLSSFVLMKSAD